MHPRTIAVLVAGLIVTASASLPGSARAQSDTAPSTAGGVESSAIGKVLSATGSVTIEHANAVVVQANLPPAGGVGQTKAGDLVYKGDVVQTGADGKIGITFTDGTTFNLSSNARMVLNEFVYDPNGKSNSTLFSLTKGTFTFIAGKVAKTGDMKIDTPVATMGIRGTTPHVRISDDGSVEFSTLIEENKNRATGKRVVPINQRQANKEPEPDTPSPQRAQNNQDKRPSINLQICKGC
jgi:hypothetical protein